MAKAKKEKGKKSTSVTDAELEALEALDDVEALADDTAPAATTAKGKGGSAKGGKKGAKKNGVADGIGTAELAEAAGTDGRSLRMYLRKAGIAKDEDKGRYWWKSLDDKEAKKILKAVKAGAVEEVKREGLERLKASKAAKDGKKGKKDKKKKSKK